MENMRTIAMNMNPLDVLAIDITSNMRALVDDQTPFAMLSCLVSKDSIKQTGTH
jgi:hypothetical protein